MSDQAFHEIQLSGKQLVFLFMSAVVVLVIVFLLGVGVGRGVRSAVGDAPITAQADPAPMPLPGDEAPTEAASGKAAETELSYHDMLLGTSTAGVQPPPADPPKPTTESGPPAVAESVPDPVQPPTPTPTPAAAAAAPVGGDWFLQTGAYGTIAVANSQVDKLKKLNVPAFVLPPAAGGTDKLYRVRIGPYAGRDEAQQVRIRLQGQGISSSITR